MCRRDYMRLNLILSYLSEMNSRTCGVYTYPCVVTGRSSRNTRYTYYIWLNCPLKLKKTEMIIGVPVTETMMAYYLNKFTQE